MIDIGGYHPDPSVSRYPTGAIFENEGRKLYDLIRERKPNLVVEVGAHSGCSTNWLAAGIIDNGKGRLISIDKGEFNDITPLWGFVKEEYKRVITFIRDDFNNVDIDEPIDFLFEDGSHAPGFTESVLRKYKAKTIVCHDYLHRDVGVNISSGMKAFYDNIEEFLEPPSDCGLGIVKL
jgi:predicted O-methyltransferase YrrM